MSTDKPKSNIPQPGENIVWNNKDSHTRSKQKHTELPFRVHESEHNGSIKIFGKGGYVCEVVNHVNSPHGIERGRIDAEFIVRACNNHEKLIEALSKLIEDVRFFENDISNNEYPHNQEAIINAEELIERLNGKLEHI